MYGGLSEERNHRKLHVSSILFIPEGMWGIFERGLPKGVWRESSPFASNTLILFYNKLTSCYNNKNGVNRKNY